jgi:hypothetical protein
LNATTESAASRDQIASQRLVCKAFAAFSGLRGGPLPASELLTAVKVDEQFLTKIVSFVQHRIPISGNGAGMTPIACCAARWVGS